MVIMSALNSGSISRLKKSWEQIDRKVMTYYEEIEQLNSPNGNFNNLRMATATAPLPCLPFLGIYLSDLVFLNENPNEINGLINYLKMQQIGNVISSIKNFQSKNYTLSLVDPCIEEYINFKYNTSSIFSEDGAFDRSKEIEPIVKN